MADISQAVVVKLLAEDRTSAAFRSLDKSLKGMQDTVRNVAAAVAGAFAFKDVIDTTRKFGQELDMLQDQFGLVAEDASKLAFISKSVGLPVEDLSNAFAQLGKRLGDGSDVFNKWGITAADARGNILPLGDVIRNVKERFQELGPGAARTAASMDLFGRSGRQLLDFFSLTDKQIEGFIAKAELMGMVLDGKGVEAIDDFNRQIIEMGQWMEAIKLAIGQKLIPILVGLFQWIRQNSGAFKAFGEVLNRAFGFIKQIADAVGRFVQKLGTGGLLGALQSLAGDVGEAVKKLLDDIGEKLDSFGPVGTIAKDALLALGGAVVIAKIAEAVAAIASIPAALKKIPARTVLLIDVVLVGIAVAEVAQTVDLIASNWETWRKAAHQGHLEMKGDSEDFGRLTVKRLVEWGDAFDAFGTGVRQVFTNIGQWWDQTIFDMTVKLNQVILKINSIAGTSLPTFGTGDRAATGNSNVDDVRRDRFTGQAASSMDRLATLDDIYAAYTRNHGVMPEFNWANSILALGPMWSEVQRLAHGGIVTKPTMAMIGESGPEAVVPLGRGGMGGNTYNLTVQVAGSVISERELVDVLNDRLMRQLFAQRALAF